MTTTVCLEVGAKKVFASALEWPGWCRSERTEDGALEVLDRYLARYRAVAELAGVDLSALGPPYDVVERAPGNATTDFGAPAVVAAAERGGLGVEDATRLGALVEAAWRFLAEVAIGAPPALRKGPRGGGRDRDQIVQHVAEAEQAYARKLDIRGVKDPAALRQALAARWRPPSPTSARPALTGDTPWPLRYAMRRIAWHALDHAWEIQDRS